MKDLIISTYERIVRQFLCIGSALIVSAALPNQASASVPPTPTSPSPGSTTSPGPTQASSTVTLSWGASSGATYYDLGVVDVATGDFVVNTTTTTANYTATLTAGKTYKWNVAAGDAAGESHFTTVLYFQTPGAIPATPTSPSPGSTTSPGPTQASSTVTLSWGASSGATYYDLGVVDVATGNFVVNTTTTTANYTATLAAGKTYRWNVAAGDAAGESLFTTVIYFQTPGLTTTAPQGADFNANGDSITWQQEISDSPSFLFVKAAQGDNINSFLPSNMSGVPAVTSGFTFGVFDYADPDEYANPSTRVSDPSNSGEVTTDAHAAANSFYQIAKPYLTAGHLEPALDLEDDLNQAGNGLWHGGFNLRSSITAAPVWTWSQIAEWVAAWTTQLQQDLQQDGGPAVTPILYMNQNYAQNLSPSLINSYLSSPISFQLWIADVNNLPNDNPNNPNPSIGSWPTWAIEQYDQSGPTPPGDLDVLNSSTTVDSLEIQAAGVHDTQPPTLSINSPANNIDVTSQNLSVSGTATDGGKGDSGISSVTVNGVAANSDTSSGANTANWNANVTLNSGVNTITVVATDGAGNTSQQQLGVNYISSGGGGATPPIISSPAFSGTTVSLTTPSQAGFKYILEHTDSLTVPAWIPDQTNDGSGGIIGLTNAGVAVQSRFYRVRVVPAQ